MKEYVYMILWIDFEYFYPQLYIIGLMILIKLFYIKRVRIMAQSIKYSPHKHLDLNLIPSSHMKVS